jgi:hypothetical protein
MNRPAPRPLSSDFPNLPATRALSISRAILALARDHGVDGPVENCRRSWPDDAVALGYVTRAAVVPSSLATVSTFSRTQIDIAVDILGTGSAFAAAVRDATRVDFGRNAAVFVHGLVRDGTAFGFTAEGSPLRVVQDDVSGGVTLTAGKRCGMIFTLTRELIEFSNAETLIRALIAENFGAGLDSIFFGTAAAVSTIQPAGIRYNVSGLTATTSGGTNAMETDLAMLGGAVASIGNGRVVYVAAAKEYLKIKARLPLFNLPLYASAGLADGVVLCFAPSALAISSSDRPLRLDISNQAVLHMEDTSPQPLVTTGGVVSAPIRSVFQTDSKALRLVLDDIDWSWRSAASSCISWTSSVSW